LSGNLGITLIKQPSQVSFVPVRMASVGRHDQSHTLFAGPVESTESTMSKSKQDCCHPAFNGCCHIKSNGAKLADNREC
jgi:hypothetical protein